VKAPGEQPATLEEPQPARAPEAASAPLALGGVSNMDSVLALQRSAGNAAVTGRIVDALEDRALLRAIARSARERTAPPEHRSPALLLRSQLRSRRLARSITTSGGQWDTDVYDDKIDVAPSGSNAPPAQGWRGLDITLKFKPDALVDAELIGMTQTAQSIKAGAATSLTPTVQSRSITSADAQPLNTGGAPGETDEGMHVDRASAYNNPIYPVNDQASTSLADTSTSPGWGEHGFHFKDGTGTLMQRDGKLIDKPRLSGAQTDARQIFETTAIATKGAQAGTYYGSVRWGWRTDGGTYTKLPLSKVSDGVPSSTFLKSAQLWNASKSSTGADTVDLPVPDVKVTTGPVTLRPRPPMIDIPLPVGTRVQIVQDYVVPLLAGTVKVVDGPDTGVTGEVDGGEWPNIVDERA
jgi:hypothetical protein